MKKNTFYLLVIFLLYSFINFNFIKPTDFSACSFISSACTVDLTNPITGLKVDSVQNIIYGKTPAATGFIDVLYEEDRCDGLSNQPTTCETYSDSLRYNVFFPDSINNQRISYSSCGLPVIIMFHGGSFFECSSLNNRGITYLCRELSKRGFIVFNVEYRRGVLPDNRSSPNPIFNFVSAQQLLALYRASQDARGAIRTIIYKQRVNDNGGRFQIDTSSIFIGGISAGSLIAMNAAYYEFQYQNDQGYAGVSSVLGDIDQDFYIGDTTIEYLPKIRGVLDMWGGMSIDISKKNNPRSFFNNNNYFPPLIAFQGLNDNIFPVDTASIYYSFDSSASKKTNFNVERNCLVSGTSLSLDTRRDTADAYGIGAEVLFRIFNYKGVSVEVYIDCDMAHGLDDDGVNFKSDFGTGYNNQDSVYSYIAGRTNTFFIAILKNIDDSLGRSRFVECRNNRVKCNISDNAACSYSVNDENNYTCDDYFNP